MGEGFQSFCYDCTDIDECASGAHVCSDVALCLNAPGSYNCSCLDGYDGDGFNCTGVLLVDGKAGLIVIPGVFDIVCRYERMLAAYSHMQ